MSMLVPSDGVYLSQYNIHISCKVSVYVKVSVLSVYILQAESLERAVAAAHTAKSDKPPLSGYVTNNRMIE